MGDFYDEINELVNGINAHKFNKTEVSRRIYEMKKEYGSNSFPSFAFDMQTHPWTEDYLYFLKKKSVTGACSEEFLLHLAEVSDYVYLKRKKAKVAIVSLILLLVVLIAALSIVISENEKDEQPTESVVQSSEFAIIDEDKQ